MKLHPELIQLDIYSCGDFDDTWCVDNKDQ